MEEHGVQDSARYPTGYGDFALLCSDDVVCHFPRHLLGYMSGFFKDMFSLPDTVMKNEPSPAPSEPLKVTEASETVELLLQHIDPKTSAPDINPNTIVSLLEAAQKYQVITVTKWFESEIKLKKVVVWVEDSLSQSSRSQLEPLLVTNPLLVLYCAVRFDLPRPGQLALRELTQCNSNLLQSAERDFPLHIYLHGMELRKKRIEFFKSMVTELAGLQSGSQGNRDSWPSSTRGRGSAVPLSPTKRGVVKDGERKTCVGCTAARALWILKIERAVRHEPNWSSFLAAYEKNAVKCSLCETSSWPDYHRSMLTNWEQRAVKIQRELPAWPY